MKNSNIWIIRPIQLNFTRVLDKSNEVIAEFFWLFGKVSVEQVKEKRERRQELKKLMLTPALAMSGYQSGQMSGRSSVRGRRNHSPARSQNGIA